MSRGRPLNQVWKYYDAHLACKSCGYHTHCHKPARAINHLKNCAAFKLKILQGEEEAPTFMIDAEQGPGNSSSNEPPPPLNRAELKRFQELMTKGILEGGASFTLLEQPALKEAAQMLRPNASLPLDKQLHPSFYPPAIRKRRRKCIEQLEIKVVFIHSTSMAPRSTTITLTCIILYLHLFPASYWKPRTKLKRSISCR